MCHPLVWYAVFLRPKAPAVVTQSEWADIQRWAKIPELSCESHRIITALIGQYVSLCVCVPDTVLKSCNAEKCVQYDTVSEGTEIITLGNLFSYSCTGISNETWWEYSWVTHSLCDSHTHTRASTNPPLTTPLKTHHKHMFNASNYKQHAWLNAVCHPTNTLQPFGAGECVWVSTDQKPPYYYQITWNTWLLLKHVVSPRQNDDMWL